MKRTLSLILALVMVLGTFTGVFAEEVDAETAAGALLEQLGVLEGDQDGNLMLENGLKRQDLVVMLSRLMGAEDVAKVFPGAEEILTFEDIKDEEGNVKNEFYLPYLAWAVSNGYFKGRSETEFGYGEEVAIRDYAVVLFRVLGYEEPAWADVMEEAVKLGLVEDAELVEFTRGTMALMTEVALNTKIKDSDQTLAESLEIEMPAPPAPANFELEEVTATNLREVDVKFNKAVDEDSLAKANFLLGTTEATSVALLEDAMTVRAIFEMDNQTEYTLTIKTVKDVDGLEIKDETKKFVAFDNTAPLVESVEVFGNKKVVVTFTEPVNDTAKSLANYKIDDKLFGAMIKVEGRQVHLELTSRLADGVHTFVVDSKVTDFAGFKVIANSNDIVVAKDDVKPEVASVDEVTQTKVVVTFTEPVEDRFKVSAVVGNFVDKETTDNLTYTLNFSGTYLPLSGTEITLTDVTDYYGNKDTIKINVVPTIDLVRPEVVSVTAPEQDKIVVEFTKPIDASTGTYVLKTVETTPVEISVTPAYVVKSGKNVTTKVVLTSGSDFDDGKYTLEIKGVEDLTPLKNAVIPTIQNVVVEDLTAPTAVKAVYEPANTTDKGAIYVYFDEKVDADTALEKANYSYITNADAAVVLGSSHSMSLLPDGKVVKITLAKLGANATPVPSLKSITVANVKDLAGNKMSPVYLAGANITTGLSQSSITMNTPIATAVDTVKVTVSPDINPYTLTPSDFVLRTVTTEKTIYVIDASYSASKNTITMTLSEDLSPAALYGGEAMELYVVAQNLQDIYGNKVAFGTATEVKIGVTVDDKIAPTATKIVEAKVFGKKLKIVVNLSENLKEIDGEFEKSNIIVDVDGVMGKVENVAYADATDKLPARLTITVDASPAAGKLVKISFYSHENYADSSANKLKNFNFEAKATIADVEEEDEEPVVVDKDALNNKIAEVEAEELVKAEYTEGTWEAFATALVDAKAVAANGDATQEEVDTALDNLTNAREALEKVVEDAGYTLTAVKFYNAMLSADMIKYTVTSNLEGAVSYKILLTIEGVIVDDIVVTALNETVEHYEAETVTIDILDAGDNVIKTFADIVPVYTEE